MSCTPYKTHTPHQSRPDTAYSVATAMIGVIATLGKVRPAPFIVPVTGVSTVSRSGLEAAFFCREAIKTMAISIRYGR